MNKKAAEILDALSKKLGDITTLQIQTVMSTLDIDKNGKMISLTEAKNVDGMTSSIDLIDGDIKTTISPNFYQQYPELVKFHQSREEKGSEIIEANMAALKSIVSAVLSFDKKP